MLVNASGATVASYEYDPYGKVITATGSMAAINPPLVEENHETYHSYVTTFDYSLRVRWL